MDDFWERKFMKPLIPILDVRCSISSLVMIWNSLAQCKASLCMKSLLKKGFDV